MNKEQLAKSKYKGDVREVVMTCSSMRRDSQYPVDISLEEMVNQRWGITMETFFDDLGVNPSIDTIQNIFTQPDESVRWLVPEIIRDALRLGLRKAPIWSEIIAAEQTVASPSVTMPSWNMSEALPKYVNEGETITAGDLSFGQKTFKIRKIGKGISTTYETLNYVSINIIAIFLQDFGIKLNHGIDSLMIDTLLNGEQTDGSESAPVVGVATASTFVYRDLLKVWIRMARIGRTPSAIIGGEDSAVDTLSLTEFQKREQGTSLKVLDLKTPIPSSAAYFVHGVMPATQQMVIDRSAALIKYNAQPLLVEEEKIVSSQKVATYASLTTGFGILYRDARVIIDKSLLFSGNGFPVYMNVDPLENVDF